MKVLKFILLHIVFIFIFPLNGNSQHDEGLIYGKVITKSGNAYVGQMRWADEEVFWHDIFNSIKTYGKPIKIEINIRENSNELKSQERDPWNLLEIWDDKYSGNIHQFTCRFGDIKSIQPVENGFITITFKNDYETRVKGGSNDVNSTISVLDYELGEIKIKWENIDKIYFFDTPYKVLRKFGEPLHGTVKSDAGYWTGLVQWDNDERLNNDMLDGFHEGSELHIPFSNINCIYKKGCEVQVVKKNETMLLLSGTNDVNCENRGVNVEIDKVGMITIPWESFQQLCFDHNNQQTGEAYRSYPEPKRLSGVIRTIDHKKYMGYIVYDKDESWDYEMLEGLSDKVKYHIPFRNIESITPRNSFSSNVKLRNGQSLLLEKLQDVSSKNEGIFIYNENESQPIYVAWGNIFEIIFD